jgi:hypothetical protein
MRELLAKGTIETGIGKERRRERRKGNEGTSCL